MSVIYTPKEDLRKELEKGCAHEFNDTTNYYGKISKCLKCGKEFETTTDGLREIENPELVKA